MTDSNLSTETPAREATAVPTHLTFTLMDLALLGATVIWGANFVIVKAATVEFLPLVFAALRFTLATLALALAVGGRWRKVRVARRDWLWLALLALFGNVGYQAFFTVGIKYTTATNSALIVAITPAVVAGLSQALRLERLPLIAWLGVGLSFAGLLLVVLGGPAEVSFARDTLLGNGLTLLATLSWAISIILTRPLVTRLPPLIVVTVSNVMAIPVLLLLAVPEFGAQAWDAVTRNGWGSLAASGLLAISVAYLVWTTGVQRLGSARTAIYANLIPVVALFAGVLFLDERLAPLQALGAVVVLVGIGLARQPRG